MSAPTGLALLQTYCVSDMQCIQNVLDCDDLLLRRMNFFCLSKFKLPGCPIDQAMLVFASLFCMPWVRIAPHGDHLLTKTRGLHACQPLLAPSVATSKKSNEQKLNGRQLLILLCWMPARASAIERRKRNALQMSQLPGAE